MLIFDDNWRYVPPSGISPGITNDFIGLIGKIARGNQDILERFKVYFASACGQTSSYSSSPSWAESDLRGYMDRAENNAPLYIEAFYDACEELRSKQPVPPIQHINTILAQYESHYRIDNGSLIYEGAVHIIEAPTVPKAFDQQARELIEQSLDTGERLFSEGKHRPAVQEMLWLLETITTVFEGTGEGELAIKANYFNKIIGQIRKQNKGSSLEVILGWMMNLHGYLSAPGGGGIRHGLDLKEGIATTPNEARLYCNLIKCYISFLLSEYDKVRGTETDGFSY